MGCLGGPTQSERDAVCPFSTPLVLRNLALYAWTAASGMAQGPPGSGFRYCRFQVCSQPWKLVSGSTSVRSWFFLGTTSQRRRCVPRQKAGQYGLWLSHLCQLPSTCRQPLLHLSRWQLSAGLAGLAGGTAQLMVNEQTLRGYICNGRVIERAAPGILGPCLQGRCVHSSLLCLSIDKTCDLQVKTP